MCAEIQNPGGTVVGINIAQCPWAVINIAELWIAATRALSLHERAYTLSYTLSCTYPCMQKYWNNVLNFAAVCVESSARGHQDAETDP